MQPVTRLILANMSHSITSKCIINSPYTCCKKELLEEPFSQNGIEMAKPLGSFIQ